MILKSYILKSALLIGALFFIAGNTSAQYNVLELLPGSDELRFDSKTGLHTLVGNVNFKYQGNLMYCDSAIYNKKKNLVRAYGNVHINKRDTLNLFCDSLQYDGKTQLAKLWGNVRVRDREYKLTTDSLDYNAKLSQAIYRNGGRVEGSKTREVLTSRIGYFHPDTKNFFFSKDVKYVGNEIEMTTDTLRYLYSKQTAYFFGPTDIKAKEALMHCESGFYNTSTEEGTLHKNAWIKKDSTYISGDTLLYQPLQGTYIGRGNVYYIDSTEDMSFTGNYAFASDSLRYTLLTGDAIATKMMKDDTLSIHADTLYNYKSDSLEILKAFNGASLYSDGFQAIADSIVYNKNQGCMELHRSPIVWAKEAELKGVFMDMELTDSIINRVNIYEKASILMEIEPSQYYNQIAGNNINAHFIDNEIHQAYVNGNAMTIFYPEDEESTDSTYTKRRKGMNRLYSSDLRIDLDSSEIVGITYIKQPDGAMYPMNKIEKEEQFIPGFDWKGHLRPKSKADLIAPEPLAVTVEEKEEEEDGKPVVE